MKLTDMKPRERESFWAGVSMGMMGGYIGSLVTMLVWKFVMDALIG